MLKPNVAHISPTLQENWLQSMAGFPTYGRFFYLARAALNPPTSLCKKLFPAIDEWHDRLAAKELSPGDSPSMKMHLYR
ncbi:hypothetical protein [Absidia glauca]|uniref:Ndc10 domain-containing protein n=1 Tax=Absidia glauca TaxID=4829 RepID=A0A163M6T7_ABSGL|nr:hypothetical protein [Absidia glauca]